MTRRVILQPRRARPFFGRHPWVYAGAVAAVEGAPADGDAVEVHSHGGHFIAHGLYNSRSKIRVRLYSWSQDEPLERAFFARRLDAAVRLRQLLGLRGPGRVSAREDEAPAEPGVRARQEPRPPESKPQLAAGGACRLVFSEGDGLSGLTVDQYDQWLVVQFTALGLALRRELLTELLVERLQPAGIYLRTERGIGSLEGLDLHDTLLWGSVPAGPVVVEEAGLRFRVNLVEGQKTGYYLDQRDNRQAVARLAAGRRVLDAFCYTGGFGLYAARAGAAEVVGVDVSEPALALAEENARLNDLQGIRFVRGDVFDQLDALVGDGAKFGLVVLDPPKFARRRGAVEEALRGYRRLQTLALRLLEPDGILAVCCCSGLITMDMLEELLAQVAVEERRDVQILERRGQAADHPVAVTCLESNYLKCLIGRVL